MKIKRLFAVHSVTEDAKVINWKELGGSLQHLVARKEKILELNKEYKKDIESHEPKGYLNHESENNHQIIHIFSSISKIGVV